mmetsp:Transcript_7417/g.10014  ORF Transcript_7417/g.10014 Transcript_7417/m.10014 type:complete len:429 (-) Transcript_7417:99-1385(-)|eukprot:CAMPEP_0201487000 /NCGR_PEP_ID=MMETSP0151_2-20130828/11016_1 /ASSEMBLY_ACC=CAM_ASM_000257 /TAXON_ID=200890 /ORGANISM="Paramoeba atlantica, Strain 621/1 / CCAP 1560/9" /LENGTH=428 /DNA_ID=CAMNT_0047871911 /DNA_START=142 /DNA_END=1428 /DNA_ORIENTATION=-
MSSSSPDELAPSPEPPYLSSSQSEDHLSRSLFNRQQEADFGSGSGSVSGHRRSASSCVGKKRVRRRTLSTSKEKLLVKKSSNKIPREPIPLEHEWTFWFDGRSGVGMREHDYKHSIVPIGSFDSIQDFWRYWNNIEPWKFANFSNLRLFKKGITPMWEDKANLNGGRWVMQCEKEHSHIYLGKLVLAVIGEQLLESEKMCGMVYQVRKTHDILSLWSAVGGPDHYIQGVIDQLRRILQLPENTPIGFVLHQGSIRWNANQKSLSSKGGKGKQGHVPSRLTASAPDSQSSKVPYYFQKNSQGSVSDSCVKPPCLSLSSVVPINSPSLPFEEEVLTEVMPNGPQLSEGLSKTIARIRSGEDLPLQEIQALSSSEPRGTIQEATTTKFEEKLLKKKGIRGTKELLCITTAITSAFLVAVAAVAVRADFLAL